jgi:hypothetical protein
VRFFEAIVTGFYSPTAKLSSNSSKLHSKSKGKVVPCLINQAALHKDVSGSGGIFQPFLTSALYEREWSASRPNHFIPREITPVLTGWENCYVSGLSGSCEEENISCLCRESNPGRPAHSFSLYQLGYHASSYTA